MQRARKLLVADRRPGGAGMQVLTTAPPLVADRHPDGAGGDDGSAPAAATAAATAIAATTVAAATSAATSTPSYARAARGSGC